MIAPKGWEIGPAGARNRRKATVKVGRNPLLRLLYMIRLFPLILKMKQTLKSGSFVQSGQISSVGVRNTRKILNAINH